MQEIFDEVLNKEDQAARIVEEAKARALEIGALAEKEYNTLLKEAREKSRTELAEGARAIQEEQAARVKAALDDYDIKWKELQENSAEKMSGLAKRLAAIASSTEA